MDEREKVEEMTVERDCSILNEDYKICYNYKGSKITVPPPMMRSWADSRLNLELLKAVEKAGYKTPSPIQMAAIPLGLQQRDVIGIADTDSGKTAAFILPMLSYIVKMKKSLSAATATAEEKGGPYALVLAPTRQLAEQIEEETLKFAKYLGFKVVTIAGTGEEQIRFKISQGCEIVIATPFRLINCLDRCSVALNNCNYVVLYEPDRMITIGYECCMTRIFDAMPPSSRAADDEEFHDDDKKIIYRTTHMFSAIMTPVVEMLASKYLRNPVVVTVRKEATTDDFICKQNLIMMDFSPSEKFYNLQRLLGDLNDDQAIVFVDPVHEYFVANDLVRDGYRVTTLNMGDLEGFRTRRYNVLVVPGIVRHGVKYLPDVLHVINFDMPQDIETYTHRLRHFGRAARIGPASVVTTFLTLLDNGLFYDLKLLLYQSNSPVPPELASYNAVAPPVFKRHHPL